MHCFGTNLYGFKVIGPRKVDFSVFLSVDLWIETVKSTQYGTKNLATTVKGNLKYCQRVTLFLSVSN
jgi:hypothetical protein